MRSLLALGLLAGLQLNSKAQVANYDLFEEDFLNQTGPSTVTSNNWAFTSRVFLDSTSNASAASVSLNGNSNAMSLIGTNPVTYQYQATFATQAAMEAAYPLSTVYVDSISGGDLGSDSGNITVPGHDTLPYPSAIPSISDYSALQSLNTAQPFTFTFSGFNNISSGSINSYLFLDVYDSTTGADVFSDDFTSATTTSIPMPANTLTPGDSYSVSLVYDNREQTTDDGFTSSGPGIDPFVGFDYSTTADFTTLAVPEPTTWALLLGALGLLALRRKLVSRS